MNYTFKPFSKNIIFLDTEFSTLDPYKGEILSIGLVKMSGEELYLELEYDGTISSWVKKYIIPTLKDKKVSRKEAIKRIKKFVGKDMPTVVAYVNQYDMIYIYKLFNKSKRPFYWLPIDFASILFGMGLDPYLIGHDHDKKFLKNIGVNIGKFSHTHNALDDAKLLREIYLKMCLYTPGVSGHIKMVDKVKT